MRRRPPPDFLREDVIEDMPRTPGRAGVIAQWILYAVALGIAVWSLLP